MTAREDGAGRSRKSAPDTRNPSVASVPADYDIDQRHRSALIEWTNEVLLVEAPASSRGLNGRLHPLGELAVLRPDGTWLHLQASVCVEGPDEDEVSR
ncbi:MAG: hypothetical protein GEV08_07790 [Acidimicrobiia bacterium]|nr:hypothetical protein [Acidimicrobiia bacterium]